tara:strand:+ start:695 stop:889 length:195 start_codon:yes stop_codon:yes gene_type:complete
MADTTRRKNKKAADKKVVENRDEAVISDILTRLNELTDVINEHSNAINLISAQLGKAMDRLGLE